nr:RNA polymerase sigma factor SigZ [Uliginosibacterium gangwonense]
MQAWHDHERELLNWLTRKIADREAAKDLLHDLFLRAVRQGSRFCSIENARAWLFEVARNAVADQLRRTRETVEVPEDLVAEESERHPVDSLASCLPRVLGELSSEDREAITLCDLEGMSQEDFAARIGLSLSAAKSRVQRARKRLKNQLTTACQVEHDASGQVCGFVPRPAQPESAPANKDCSTKPGCCDN